MATSDLAKQIIDEIYTDDIYSPFLQLGFFEKALSDNPDIS